MKTTCSLRSHLCRHQATTGLIQFWVHSRLCNLWGIGVLFMCNMGLIWIVFLMMSKDIHSGCTHHITINQIRKIYLHSVLSVDEWSWSITATFILAMFHLSKHSDIRTFKRGCDFCWTGIEIIFKLLYTTYFVFWIIVSLFKALN